MEPSSNLEDKASKPDLAMLPTEALEEVAKVFMFGAKKHGRFNWAHNDINWTVFASACLRHIFKWVRGIDHDEETGHSHLAHATANLLILLYLIKHKGENDDRLV